MQGHIQIICMLMNLLFYTANLFNDFGDVQWFVLLVSFFVSASQHTECTQPDRAVQMQSEVEIEANSVRPQPSKSIQFDMFRFASVQVDPI